MFCHLSRCPVGYEPNAYYTKYMSIRSSISMAIIIISIMSGSRGSDDPFPFRLSHSILLPLNFYSFFLFSFLIISLSTLLRVCIAVCVCLSSAEVHAVRFRRRDELDREKKERQNRISLIISSRRIIIWCVAERDKYHAPYRKYGGPDRMSSASGN
jgi:hypothetical protein